MEFSIILLEDNFLWNIDLVLGKCIMSFRFHSTKNIEINYEHLNACGKVCSSSLLVAKKEKKI